MVRGKLRPRDKIARHIARKQLVDPIDRMLGDVGEHVAEVGFCQIHRYRISIDSPPFVMVFTRAPPKGVLA